MNDIPRAAWASVMAKARETFGARNRFGVHAYGIGPRVRRGRATRDAVLNVYVIRKIAAPRHPVPELTFMLGKLRVSLIPNVIATGRRSHADFGTRLPYSGVHAGAVISTSPPRGARRHRLFATTGRRQTHMLTAGHLFAPGRRARGACCERTVRTAAPHWSPQFELADDSGTDAALIELTAAGRRWCANAERSCKTI